MISFTNDEGVIRPLGEHVSLTTTRPVLLLSDDDSWRENASCRDTDPDLFFPVGSTGPALEQIATAISVCDDCPSKKPCLDFALTTNQDSGVWGGTSEEDRRKIRRRWLAERRKSA